MSKKYKNQIAYPGNTSTESDDDICIIDEVTSESKRELCHSVTPLTISDSSSSQDESRLKKKYVKLSNDSSSNSENESKKKQWKNQTRKKPEREFIINKRGIAEQSSKRFAIDRNGASSSSFAHEFHSCEVCNLHFHTYDEYLMHMQDKRHQKVVKNMERRRRSTAEKYPEVNGNESDLSRASHRYLEYPPVPAGVTRRKVRDESVLQSLIGKDFPPCPGLEYVTEIRGIRETSYFCGICGSLYNEQKIISHLKKCKHQINTLKSLAPDLYDRLARYPKSKRKEILCDMLKDIQEKDGIGRIVVEKDYLDEDRQRGNGSLQTLDTPGTSSVNRGVPLYEVKYGMPYSMTTDNQILDKSKIDYYCVKCECNMFDNVMWESHSKRNPSLKGIRKYPVGLVTKTVVAEHRPNSVAFLVDRLSAEEEPLVGLDYVREFQHEEANREKETYHCIICGECSSCIDVIHHLASLGHRIKYLEYINHASVDYVCNLDRRANKTFYQVEEICRAIQKEFGPGSPQVYIVKDQKKDD